MNWKLKGEKNLTLPTIGVKFFMLLLFYLWNKQLRPLIKSLCSASIGDSDYTECIKCMESLVNIGELRVDIDVCFGTGPDERQQEEVERRIWLELDEYLHAYQDMSDRHMALAKHANQLKVLYAKPGLATSTSPPLVAVPPTAAANITTGDIKPNGKDKTAPNREM